MDLCTYVKTCKCTYICIHVEMYAYVCMYIYVCICEYVNSKK